LTGDEPLHESERLAPAPPVPESGVRRLIQLATIDVGPLRRHRDFRLLFAGQAVSFFGSIIWNQTIPDRLRGRLAGIEQVSYSTGPLLGNVEAGAVASLAGLRTSIVSGGVLCVAGVVVAVALLPAFWRYDARELQPVPA